MAGFNSFNPYPQARNYTPATVPNYTQMRPQIQPSAAQKIIKVNGYNGAMQQPLAPNSEALWPDENNPWVWFVQTDALGYKQQPVAYALTPIHEERPADINDINARLKKLEAIINEQSDFTANKRKTKRPADTDAE